MDIAKVLRYPLFEMSGGQVTVGSLLVGLLVIIAAWTLAAITGRALLRVLHLRGVQKAARFAIVKITRYLLVLTGFLVGLASIGLRLDALLAASAALLVGIGLGLQAIVQNFVSGLILLVERPVGAGDFVRIGDAYGSVVDIGLRATRVITRDEVTIIVPNSELVTGQVVNYSVPTTKLRIRIDVGVAYGSDTELVKETLLAVARASSHTLAEPNPEVRFESFGDSSLDFSLLVWIEHPREDQRIASDLRFAIDAGFREHGITIPFPQRDVHMIEPRRVA